MGITSNSQRDTRAVILWGTALCVVATALTAILFLLYQEVDVWGGFRPAHAFLSPGPSERLYPESVFRTRANAWSNLAYVYVGVLAALASATDWRWRRRGGHLLETPALGIFFGASCVYLGVGSGIFHASLTHWGQQLDVAAMYSTLVALIALNVDRLLPRAGKVALWPLWLVAAVVVDALLYVYKWSMSSSIVLPGLILSVMVFVVWNRARRTQVCDRRWFAASVVALILAAASRGLDRIAPLSNPDVWLKGHALWHLFTAASLGCMYAYYRTETPSRGATTSASPG